MTEAHEQLIRDLSRRLELATRGQVSIDPNRLRAISNYLDEKGLTQHAAIKADAEWLLLIADALDGPSEEMLALVRGAALEAPPNGPWRVAQQSGLIPQPRFVEYYEGPRPEQYGARWDANGFPTAEEAQAVADALNRLERR